MKSAENIKKDWIQKIEKNGLQVIEYISINEVKCVCNACGYVKIDNCRNLGYFKFKCKYCNLLSKSILLKEKLVEILEINGNKLKLKCKLNHIYEQTRGNFLCNKKCNKCYLEDKIFTEQDIKEKIKEIHGDMYKYDFKNFKNVHSKIEIICRKNHIFKQKISNHLQGKGCPICRESLGERTIENYLISKNINFKRQKQFEDCRNINKLKFDFYLKDYNYIIEFDGIQHFEPIKIFGGEKKFVETVVNDKIKNDYCIKNNINLCRISYKENIIDKLRRIPILT